MLTKRNSLLILAEVTKGTPITPTAVLKSYDVTMVADDDFIDIGFSGSLGMDVGVIGATTGTCSFKCNLRSDGSASMDVGVAEALKGCGFVPTVDVWTPVASVALQNTVTIAMHSDGILKSLTGAMGSFTIEVKSAGVFELSFEFKGQFSSVTDATYVIPTHTTVLPPVFKLGTLTIDAFEPKVSTIKIDIGNELAPINDGEAESGVLHYAITSRNVTCEMDMQANLVADYDVFGLWRASTTAALTLSAGITNNAFAITAPKLQHKAPKQGDRDGLLLHEINAQLCESVGNDEIVITVS